MVHGSDTVRGERGQAIVELAGVLFVVAVIIAAVAGTGLAQQLSGGISRSVAAVLGGRSAAAAGTAPGSPAGGPGGVGSPVASGGGSPGAAGGGSPAAPGGGSPGAAGGGSPAGTPGGSPGVAQTGGAAAPGDGSGNRGPQSSRLPSGGQRPYAPPKGAHGKPQRVRGGGFEDKNGNVWKWDPSGHAGPHWDVEHPDGSHTNVAPDGTVIGKDNFPNKAPQGSGSGDAGSGTANAVTHAASGAAILGTLGTILWWAGKVASPACGPFAPVCAIVG